MNSRKKVAFLLAAALVLVLVSAMGAGCGSQKSNGTNGANTSSPKIAPDFSVKTLTDETVSFSANLKGKPTVLNFAASWCGPCEYEAPILVKAYQKYKDRVQFFGIAVRDNEEDQRAFAQRHGLEFPIGLDTDGKVLYQYQRAGKVSLSGIPTTFFIDREGNIADFFIGPISEKTFDQKIASILPAADEGSTSTQATGQTSPPSQTVAVPPAP